MSRSKKAKSAAEPTTTLVPASKTAEQYVADHDAVVDPALQPVTRTNAKLFSDDTLYNGLVASMNAKIKPGATADDCAVWLGKVWHAKTKDCAIIRHGSYPWFDAQKLLWLVSHNLRSVAAVRGSAALPRVGTKCGNVLCMNAAHLVERITKAAVPVETPAETK